MNRLELLNSNLSFDKGEERDGEGLTFDEFVQDDRAGCDPGCQD